VLRRFLYLDTDALSDYVSALEGGLRDGVVRRQSAGGKGRGGLDARFIQAGGERTREEEETVTLNETPQSRFDRLVVLAEEDQELSGWVEVFDPDTDLPGIGVGAMLSLECEIYVPDAVKVLTGATELNDALAMLDGLMPVADTLGLDTSKMPSEDQIAAIRSVATNVSAGLVVVGEIDDSAFRIAGELKSNFVQGDLDGRVRLVGKVATQWPTGQWKPVLALPGSSLLPRQKRRELERTRPNPESQSQYLEGPALMLDVLAIYR
jgi:hypothetical protein